ncbi:MAG: hypothetical protein ACXW00_08635 [Methylobacter sp.]
MARQKKTEQLKSVVEVRLESPEEDADKASARVLAQPETLAAVTIQQWQGDIVNVNRIADELRRQTDELKTGNMQRAEAMLLSQAHTLDELFNNLARKARGQEYLKNYETFLRLALKAQTQCRATLETLSAIKNPPTIYAKQANIAHGPQQINNGVPPQAGINQNQQNELLEAHHGGQTVDTGTTGAAIAQDQAMATLE